MKSEIYNSILTLRANKQKAIAVLVDPDDISDEECILLARTAQESGITYFFVGGSMLTSDRLEATVHLLKEHASLPIILFPGNHQHITSKADGVLFLSLISGRNADFLIGQQTLAAPAVKASKLEVLPTGYMLIDSGRPTTVSYISNTQPIPRNKPEIAACTAMAGELLGLKLFYLEGGSGATLEVPSTTIAATRKAVDAPIIVGGGIDSIEKAKTAFDAGADIIVVGTAIENNPAFVSELGRLALA